MTYSFKVTRKGHVIGNSWNDFPDLKNIRNKKKFIALAQLQPEIDNHASKYDAFDVIGDVIGITWHFKNILDPDLGNWFV